MASTPVTHTEDADFAQAMGELIQTAEAAIVDPFQTQELLASALRKVEEIRKIVAKRLARHNGAEAHIVRFLARADDKFVSYHEIPDNYGNPNNKGKANRFNLNRLVAMHLVERHFDFYRLTPAGKRYHEEMFKRTAKQQRHLYKRKLRAAGLPKEEYTKAADEFYQQLLEGAGA